MYQRVIRVRIIVYRLGELVWGGDEVDDFYVYIF